MVSEAEQEQRSDDARAAEPAAGGTGTERRESLRGYRLRTEQRLRKSADFNRVYDLRQRAGDGRLLLFAAPNEIRSTRFGVSVSKKHGDAVRRNRLKRLLREAFRLSQHELPIGLDLILIPRGQSGAGLDDYRHSLVRLATKLSRRFDDAER